MLGIGIFKKKQVVNDVPDEESLQAIFNLVDNSTTAVSGTVIFRLIHLDATDIDECLQQLVSRKWIEVAYEKTGLDGISRSYYKVSERYNLMDAKDRVSRFITSVIRKAKPLVDNGHNYVVKIPTHKEFNMVFEVRQQARDYKRLLKESRMRLDSEIWEQIFEEGIQSEERKIF